MSSGRKVCAGGKAGGQGITGCKKSNKSTPTEFQQRVYNLLKKCVPKGKVTSYQVLANHLHSSARAVGGALRENPFAPIVPCHRVVMSNMSIGGFNGQIGKVWDASKQKLFLEQSQY